MRQSHRLYRLAVAPVVVFSVLTVHGLACDSVASLQSEGSLIHSCSVARTPLFGYEALQLTDDAIHTLRHNEATMQHAHLFRFGKGIQEGTSNPQKRARECKAYPGDKWPSVGAWGALSNQLIELGGNLIPTTPISAPCHQNWGSYNSSKCAAVVKGFSDPYFHEADPTSTMWLVYQGKTCMPIDSPNSTSCTLGAYPPFVVNATSVAHIQLGVNFARNNNIRLVIKNTGHCYLGKSNGAGSLSIWTHNLKDITYLPEYKSEEHAGKALKVGAGVTIRELYEAAHKYGVSALGGICESVGYTGGYIAGGGHTPLSGLWGMAADHVMALEVVTADGRFVTASNTTNSDLYWALRGGGGSTYGIVTSVIVRVHPKIPITMSKFTIAASGTVSNETFWAGVRSYFDYFIPFTDAGTYSYFWIYNRGGNLSLEMKPFFAPNHTIDSFNQLVKPWFDRLTQLGIPFTPETQHFDEFLPAYDVAWSQTKGYSPGIVGYYTSLPGNRLFPRANWEDPAKLNATFKVLRQTIERKAGSVVGGYHQAPRNRANVDNAVSPAFRQVIAFLITRTSIPEDAGPEQYKVGTQEINHEILDSWREVAPDSEGGGSYLNEAHIMEPNWQSSFYGSHYPRLLEIKRKWDPEDVFYATTGVGSEFWKVEDGDQGVQTQNGRLCRV